MSALKILFVATEATPYAKTGGLGDVVGSLPKSLKKMGVEVKVVIPLYSCIDRERYHLQKVFDNCCVHMGNCEEFFTFYQTRDAGGYDVYFIEFHKYFDRDGIYDNKYTHEAYADNAYRFSFFSRAAFQVAKAINFQPHIIHVHDWQTALIPYYLKRDNDPFFAQTKSVLTIHNLPYQGVFSKDVVPYAKIDWQDFHMNAFEDYDRVNFIKGGIRFADKITTVSPSYMREILSPMGGAGLHWLLNERRQDLSGIVNGLDTDLWNPSHDEKISYPYSLADFPQGKEENKRVLRNKLGLHQDNSPIFAMTNRLSEQKGVHMFAQCIDSVLRNMHTQVVIMGDGELWAENYFQGLQQQYQGRLSVLRFDSQLEHLVNAGSDFSLIPSLYEPCGLTQMRGQLYGSLPIVRATGGLHDTVDNYNELTGTGTGFKFYDVSPIALYNTIGWANSTYYDRPQHIQKMIKQAMKKDFSWDKSANQYLSLYNDTTKS